MGGGAANSAASGVDVDSVMRQLGVLGRFHRRVYPLVALAAVQVGLLHTTYIFLAGDVDYRYNIYSPLMTGRGHCFTRIEYNRLFPRIQ